MLLFARTEGVVNLLGVIVLTAVSGLGLAVEQPLPPAAVPSLAASTFGQTLERTFLLFVHRQRAVF